MSSCACACMCVCEYIRMSNVVQSQVIVCWSLIFKLMAMQWQVHGVIYCNISLWYKWTGALAQVYFCKYLPKLYDLYLNSLLCCQRCAGCSVLQQKCTKVNSIENCHVNRTEVKWAQIFFVFFLSVLQRRAGCRGWWSWVQRPTW